MFDCQKEKLHNTRRTEVASDPVLHTVRTLRVRGAAEVPPGAWSRTRSTSHSPAHFDICLFRPTSSSATALLSATKSSAIVRGSFPTAIPLSRVLLRRRVAAPRLTAVGRAVYRNARIPSMCVFRDSLDWRYSGGGDVARPRRRCCDRESAAREAMAGAPRIFLFSNSSLLWAARYCWWSMGRPSWSWSRHGHPRRCWSGDILFYEAAAIDWQFRVFRLTIWWRSEEPWCCQSLEITNEVKKKELSVTPWPIIIVKLDRLRLGSCAGSAIITSDQTNYHMLQPWLVLHYLSLSTKRHL